MTLRAKPLDRDPRYKVVSPRTAARAYRSVFLRTSLVDLGEVTRPIASNPPAIEFPSAEALVDIVIASIGMGSKEFVTAVSVAQMVRAVAMYVVADINLKALGSRLSLDAPTG